MDYGIQMYSVRDITSKDLRGALKKMAEIGYKYIEFAGFFGNSAEDVRSWLDEYGLEVSGTHTPLKELVDDFEGTVKYHKTIGNKNIIIPGHDLSSQEKIDEFVEAVNKFIPMLEKEGISLGFHNHSVEFRPNKDGSMVHEQLVCRTKLKFEVDTFWFFNAAGFGASGIMHRLADRMSVIHIKDGFKGGHGKPLGMGAAPIKEAYDTAKELGMLCVVESESLRPDGVTEAEVCYKWLKAQEN